MVWYGTAAKVGHQDKIKSDTRQWDTELFDAVQFNTI